MEPRPPALGMGDFRHWITRESPQKAQIYTGRKRDFPGSPELGLRASTAGDPGSIRGQGTKIPHIA